MKSRNLPAWLQFAGIPVLVALMSASLLLGQKLDLHPENQKEELRNLAAWVNFAEPACEAPTSPFYCHVHG